VDVPCRFTIAISTEAESMNTAAERLLGLSPEQIQELAKIHSFASFSYCHDDNRRNQPDRDKFLDNTKKRGF
jgi:flotillin